MIPPRSGLFIVFEGIDGSGKTTQAHLLGKALEGLGRSVHNTAEPTTRPIGQLLRSVLHGETSLSDDAALLLFAADRADHLNHPKHGIEGRLETGVDVICDRYLMSTYAYQGYDSNRVQLIQRTSENARPADITFLLQMDPDVALARKGGRGEHHENADTNCVVAKRYEHLARSLEYEQSVVVVDAARSADEVAAEILGHVKRLIGRAGRLAALDDLVEAATGKRSTIT